MIDNNEVMYNQLLQLFSEPVKPVHYTWKAVFVIDDVRIHVDNITRIDRNNDFVGKKSEMVVVELQVRPSTYIQYILPNKHRLRLQLSRLPVGDRGDTSFVTQQIKQDFYAFLTDPQSPSIQAQSRFTEGGSGEDDLVGFQTIFVQLVDESYFHYRQFYEAGSFKNTTIEELVKGLMTKRIKTPSLGEVGVGVDIVPPSNIDRYVQRVIPNNVKLDDLPGYIQYKYGIYSSGCGYYMHKNKWYIYPLLDFKRFNLSKRKLYIILMAPDEMQGSDNTYYVEGDNIYIFATGQVRHTDYSEHALNSHGNAFIYSNNRNMLDRFYDATPQKPEIPSGRNFHKVYASQSDREMKFFAEPRVMLDDNPYRMMSEIAMGLVANLTVTWEASNTQLIHPGMATKVLYKNRGAVTSLYGTVMAFNTVTEANVSNPTDNRYWNTSELVLSVQRENYKE